MDGDYTGDLVKRLMNAVDSALNLRLPRTPDPFDNLCVAKIALADKIFQTMHTCEAPCENCSNGECETYRRLWKQASVLQDKVIKE